MPSRKFQMKHSKVKQADLDKFSSAVLFDDKREDEFEDPEYEELKKALYGETGFGVFRMTDVDVETEEKEPTKVVKDDLPF